MLARIPTNLVDYKQGGESWLYGQGKKLFHTSNLTTYQFFP
jgi:hypothetical protein